MNRRQFISTNSALLVAFTMPHFSWYSDSTNAKSNIHYLLKVWCDGMLSHQLNKPEKPELHGALWCPACQNIHGRCMDAMYPFMYMYKQTRDKKYLTAAINSFEWSKNVSQPDGSWTVMPDPKTWKGISVFGAITVAETLTYFSDILPENVKSEWKNRLVQVAEYIYKTFNMTFTNINYGYSAVYALLIMGEVLENKRYIDRSDELAKEIKNWLTLPNKLVFGEGKPSDNKSPKGLYGVDLGYNVEETLNGAVLYAVHRKDNELIKILTQSLNGHLQFMLPDGAWDNSWGTRQFKWSYWGSRTTDGCQPAYLSLAHVNPVFGRAAYQSTNLLKRCTHEGLLHGGLHFKSHGVLPCIHHTFTHAKALTTVLTLNQNLKYFKSGVQLPREKQSGIQQFPEVAVWTVKEGDWLATVSAYDFEYVENSQQATGGSLAVLFHQKAGPIFMASMAKYRQVEQFNQQENPDGFDFALTPRIETFINKEWYTNLFDRTAELSEEKNDNGSTISANVQLKNERFETHKGVGSDFKITYEFSKKLTKICVKNQAKSAAGGYSLVLPVISKNEEFITIISPNEIHIKKESCVVSVKSSVPLRIKETPKSRVFNLVPGMEAVPIMVDFDNQQQVECWITVL